VKNNSIITILETISEIIDNHKTIPWKFGNYSLCLPSFNGHLFFSVILGEFDTVPPILPTRQTITFVLDGCWHFRHSVHHKSHMQNTRRLLLLCEIKKNLRRLSHTRSRKKSHTLNKQPSVSVCVCVFITACKWRRS
jgi:hypothetical protein